MSQTIDLGYVIGPQGPQGAQGATGPQGPQGNPAKVNNVSPDASGNIVIPAVYYEAQELTTAEKEQVRTNIGAEATLTFDSTPTDGSANPVTSDGIYEAIKDQVLYTAQNKTETEKAQARSNIGVVPSNRNLLDNPWFTVNQRGQSSYTGTNKYTVDRWLSGNVTNLTVTNDGITVGATQDWLSQIFEKDLFPIGTTFTVSIKLADGRIESKSAVSVNGRTYVGNIFGIGVQLLSGSEHIFNLHFGDIPTAVSLRAVKVEIGNVSTLNYDTMPNFGEQLRKCQAYYCKSFTYWHPPTVTYATSGNMSMGTARNNGSFTVRFPVEMRAMPTVTKIGTAEVYCNSSDGSESATYDSHIYPRYITPSGFVLSNNFANAFATFGCAWVADAELY